MASTSSFHQQGAFSGIEPPSKRRKIEESSRVYDVFINHRGPDVKHTLATRLYKSLEVLRIMAFLDSEEKELGASFPSTIEAAIRSASVHIAIFSKRYAESPWCLAELVLMLQSQSKIIPVFYEVKPSDLRYIESGAYADAFHKYKEKGRYVEKLKEWKEALEQVSYTAGYEFKTSDSGDCEDIVSAVEKEVQRTRRLHVAKHPVGLDKLVKEFERRCLDKLVRDFESQCGMKKAEKEKANVVGIFGMGGVGKTTLSLELFNQKRSNYTRSSFLCDVRESYARGTLPLLQRKLLEDIFCDSTHSFASDKEWTSYLRHCFARSTTLSFLIVLDDIDHVEQLDALLPMDILNKHDKGDHLVIVTTRNVGVLISAEIDIAYHLRGLDREDGRELFCWHAFDQPLPHGECEDLVLDFVIVCGGLPLSLIVLGRHVFGRKRWYWQEELEKVKETLPIDIKNRLKLSIDRLDDVEKQIFMDIACFFIGKSVTKAMLIWKGSGWRARRALETLKERCLVEEVEEGLLNRLEYKWESSPGGFALRMHDHLRDLGREMADELSYPHRVWRVRDLKCLELKGFQNILTKTKIRIFHSIVDKSIGCAITYFLGKPKDGSDASLLWLQLEYLSCLPLDLNLDINSSIPSWVPLQNLQCLRISNGCFQKLWQSDVQAPSHLEELQIRDTFVEEYPDLLGKLNNMKKLVLHAKWIQTDIWSLLESLKMNLRSVRMVGCDLEGHLAYNDTAEETAIKSIVVCDFKRVWEGGVALNDEGWCRTVMNGLESLEISEYLELEELRLTHLSCLKKVTIENCNYLRIVSGISNLPKLVELNISDCGMLEFEYLGLIGMKCLERITIDGFVKMKNFELDNCENLRSLMFGCKNIVELSIRYCAKLEKLGDLIGPSFLKKITIDGCGNLKYLRLSGLENLESVSGNLGFGQMHIIKCPVLEELPFLDKLSCLEKIEIDSCEKIQHIILPTSLIKLDVRSCRALQTVAVAGDLTELKWLVIGQCPALEELPSFARATNLAKIEIDFTGELQEINLPTGCVSLSIKECRDSQRKVRILSRTGHIELYITGCPKLDLRRLEELPLARLSCLEEIAIDSCEKLQNITLPTTLLKLNVQNCSDLQRIEGTSDLKRLVIRQCRALEELPLARLSCLEEIAIHSCEKLQNITLPTTILKLDVQNCSDLQRIEGTSDLKRLVIGECPALEELPLARLSCLEEIAIDSLEKLQNITLPTTILKLDVQNCSDLQRIEGTNDLKRLVIRQCPALEELPSFAGVNCLEEIEIMCCEKLEIITLPTSLISLSVKGCGVLQRIGGLADVTELKQLCIADCPELELPCLGRLICLQRIVIDSCENPHIISAIEELHVPGHAALTYCSSVVRRYFIDRWKSLPECTYLIGKAVDGADSSLNEHLFSDANIAVDGVTEISTGTGNLYHDWSGLGAVILCFAVVIDSSTLAENISRLV